MHTPRFRHGTPGTTTPGTVITHGRSYDCCATVCFGGRRRRVYRRLAATSGARPGDRVLDVGCGTGYFTRILADAVTASGSAHGVDPSEGVIARATTASNPPNCSFSVGVAEALDAPEGSYDVVVSSLMVHHLPEDLRPQAIGEMFRVLRPGGRLLIAEFKPPASRLGRALVRRTAGHAMADNPVHLLEPMVHAAGFQQPATGVVRPWICYVQAVKPASA